MNAGTLNELVNIYQLQDAQDEFNSVASEYKLINENVKANVKFNSENITLRDDYTIVTNVTFTLRHYYKHVRPIDYLIEYNGQRYKVFSSDFQKFNQCVILKCVTIDE